MGGASADRDVSGDDDIEYEPPPAAWQLTLDEATATHTLDVDWEAVHKAVQEWNDDGSHGVGQTKLLHWWIQATNNSNSAWRSVTIISSAPS